VKKVTLKRSEIVELVNIFEAIAGVKAHEVDDKLDVQTFKWRAGRNEQKCRSLCEEFKTEMAKIQSTKGAPSDLQEYLDKQDELFKKHAVKDDSGAPIVDGEGNVNIDKASRDALKAEVDALMAEHPDVVLWSSDRDAKAEAYMNEAVDVELFAFPWEKLPSGIHGSYIEAAKVMLDGVPQE
jgi:hypothetical protein